MSVNTSSTLATSTFYPLVIERSYSQSAFWDVSPYIRTINGPFSLAISTRQDAGDLGVLMKKCDLVDLGPSTMLNLVDESCGSTWASLGFNHPKTTFWKIKIIRQDLFDDVLELRYAIIWMHIHLHVHIHKTYQYTHICICTYIYNMYTYNVM